MGDDPGRLEGGTLMRWDVVSSHVSYIVVNCDGTQVATEKNRKRAFLLMANLNITDPGEAPHRVFRIETMEYDEGSVVPED